MNTEAEDEQQLFFGEAFLDDHAGSIIREPRIAIIELIANSYDAGATRVEISWPDAIGGQFTVSDNGGGMTKAEFELRWKTLSYNRTSSQGRYAEDPNNIAGERRVAFGRSGKGRHGAFCFSDAYEIATVKNGIMLRVQVARTSGELPFKFTTLEEVTANHRGTTITSEIQRHYIDESAVREIIGAKFSAIPSFQVFLNRQTIQLLDLKHLQTTTLTVPNIGDVIIHQIDSEKSDRTTLLRGICWWVKRRGVGNPSWEGLEGEGAYLDGRGSLARRYSFVVEADILEKDRKPDWTGFYASRDFNAVRQAVHHHVIQTLNQLQAETRKDRKRAALEKTKSVLQDMGTVSRQQVASFVDEIQEKCPTMSERDLFRAAEVFSKLENAKTGYDLLKQLKQCSPEDLDTWNDLMRKWGAKSAALVLNELEGRLRLISRMKSLVDSPLADELHDIQPLFERGLWIFGPEYEGVQFHSNRGLATVIRKMLGGTDESIPKRRPDFVALPDSSIGAYASPAYDSVNGEIIGIKKVLLVELKKGGFELKQKEVDQARNYAKELLKAGEIRPDTEIVGYVLGAELEHGLEELKHGTTIRIIPFSYRNFLARAENRTFHLQRRIEQSGFDIPKDEVIDEVLAEQDLTEFDAPELAAVQT